MSNYIVGDIQGCLDELKLLLDQAQFDPKKDVLWLAGDLVARGPKSLETLRFVYNLRHAARCILGNHDLHLLAVSIGLHKPNPKDKTLPIFDAPDRHILLEWLRTQPLLAEHDEFMMCHAGISPLWDMDTARKNANQIQTILKSQHWKWLVRNMYRDQPALWDESLQGLDRYRCIINNFTRMRYCYIDGSLNMKCKVPPVELENNELIPWFKVKQRKPLTKTVIFGHWAALMGCHDKEADVIGLDTGCVWGEHLTMIRWEDKQLFTQASLTAI